MSMFLIVRSSSDPDEWRITVRSQITPQSQKVRLSIAEIWGFCWVVHIRAQRPIVKSVQRDQFDRAQARAKSGFLFSRIDLGRIVALWQRSMQQA